MRKVAIVGVGLMGGSLGMALKNVKRKRCAYFVLGIGRNVNNLKLAKRKGAVDEFSTKLEDIKDCDAVFICYPVNMVVDTYKKAAKIVSKKTVIADIGSIKSKIQNTINGLIAKNKNLPLFVGCHPMAGIEKNGIKYAKKDLYKNEDVVITGPENSLISKIWKDAGCRTVFMSASLHDETVAFTSHLPHIISFNFYKMFKDKKDKNSKLDRIKGGSFRSITRVAKSSPDMWLPIFLGNKDNLRKLTKEFCGRMQKFVLTLNDKKNLRKLLKKSINNEN